MAKKDGSNPFAAAASKRQAEQDALKQGLAQDAAAGAAQEDSPCFRASCSACRLLAAAAKGLLPSFLAISILLSRSGPCAHREGRRTTD